MLFKLSFILLWSCSLNMISFLLLSSHSSFVKKLSIISSFISAALSLTEIRLLSSRVPVSMSRSQTLNRRRSHPSNLLTFFLLVNHHFVLASRHHVRGRATHCPALWASSSMSQLSTIAPSSLWHLIIHIIQSLECSLLGKGCLMQPMMDSGPRNLPNLTCVAVALLLNNLLRVFTYLRFPLVLIFGSILLISTLVIGTQHVVDSSIPVKIALGSWIYVPLTWDCSGCNRLTCSLATSKLKWFLFRAFVATSANQRGREIRVLVVVVR